MRSIHRSLRVAAVAAIAIVFAGSSALATTTSTNTGSLGAAANGTNADGVTFVTGVVAAGGDQAAKYGATGQNTSVPFQSGLNPASASPFTIEFWANPTATDNDDSPVSNRVAAGNRSGWAFFQRGEATGWNIKMYNGTGSAVGWDLTGGTATLNAWSHVVATWDGSAGQLFVNGVLADSTNDANAASLTYNANTSTASLLVAATDTGSPYNGSVDEVAFYNSVLTPAKIASHFNLASSVTPGAYYSQIQADGALLQLSNAVPEPSSMMLLGAGAAALVARRGRRRGA